MANIRPILKASDRFLTQLDRMGDAAVKQMLARYGATQRVLQDSLDALLKQLQALENPTPAQLYRLDRYQTMLRQVNTEMGALGKEMAGRMPGVAGSASDLGLEAAKELVLRQSPGIVGVFNRMSVAGVKKAASFVAPRSPLVRMLESQYGRGWADVIASQYVSGVAMGLSPYDIVRNIRQTFDIAMPADLNRIIRTAQLWSYRETNREAWQQSGVVDSWWWSSALDDTTCSSCYAMHGSIHPVSEVLNDHFCGRCSPVPIISSDADYQAEPLNIQTGEEIFSGYPESRQADIANAGGWLPQLKAWQDGAIDFSDMSRTTSNDIYGDMRSVAPLSALLGDKAKEYYA